MDTIGTNNDIRQCVQAKRKFAPNVGDCCADNAAKNCIQPAWPDFQPYGFNAPFIPSSGLTFAQIQEQIAAKGTPFAFTWNWVGGNAHMQVAYGYKVQNGQQSVMTFNPLPKNTGYSKWITYEEYLSDPKDHTHSRDYYNVVPLQPGTSLAAARAESVDTKARTGTTASDPVPETSSKTRPSTPAPPESQAKKSLRPNSMLKGALPEQTGPFKEALQSAQTALVTGIADLAPREFSEPPPGAGPAGIGVATPVVNLPVSALVAEGDSKQKKAQTPEALAIVLDTQLNASPEEIAVPVVGPSNQTGVLVLRKQPSGWKSVSFEEASPLSEALKESNITNSARSVVNYKDADVLFGARVDNPSPQAAYRLSGVVNVRGFNVSFLAYEHERQLQLAPLWDSPEFGFVAGQLTPASQVMRILRDKGTLTEAPR